VIAPSRPLARALPSATAARAWAAAHGLDHVATSTIGSLKHETRFCTSPDGVGLAYAIDGYGPPLVKASNWMTHLDYERESPVWRHWVKELSRGRTLIRYDERGCGLSDRQFDGTPTLDTYVGDLAAVVDAAELERFALLGLSGGGPTAIEYAARNPERVSRLVLYGTWARGRDLRGDDAAEQTRLLGELIRVGWGGTIPAFRQVFSSIYIPSAGEDQKRWYDDLQQASSSGAMAARLWQSRSGIDISDTARRITQPALVLHARDDGAVPYEEGRHLASLLPDARFVTLESDNHILQQAEPAWRAFLTQVRAFLGDDERAPTVAADLSDLSAREREVLELVAAGLSNEEIGKKLFLSTRTVERHLSNVYAKFGCQASPRAQPPPRATRVPDNNRQRPTLRIEWRRCRAPRRAFDRGDIRRIAGTPLARPAGADVAHESTVLGLYPALRGSERGRTYQDEAR
jgi:pimeloyl-ACP methyl ester carboxylesterase/DNA-binding CsgD family transcriptional regulator